MGISKANSQPVQQADRYGYWVGLFGFVLAAVVFIGAPLLALRWAALPFPGFVVESTLVVAGPSGAGWAGREAGVVHPQQVVAVDGQQVSGPREFEALFAGLEVGDSIRVDVRLPDGSRQSFSEIPLTTFPIRDLLRMFVLPYGIGLVYFLIGSWILFARGKTRPGAAFSLFCFSAAVASALTFDLVASKQGVWLWTLAVALLGGTMIRLALLFPSGQPASWGGGWLIRLALGTSLALALWGWWALSSDEFPWAYISAWRGSYIYLALGILTLEAIMLYHERRNPQEVARRQARIILLGSVVSFTPIAIWALSPAVGFPVEWNPALFIPTLIFFPLSIAAAIVRYRLWDLDFIVNRTLVYGAVTVILALLFFGVVLAIQPALTLLYGRPSPLAIAIATLAIAALFNPLRRRLQNLIDRRFYRSKYQAGQALEAFLESLREEVDLNRLIDRLEDIVSQMIHPAHVFTWLRISRGYSVHLPGIEALRKGGQGVEISPDDPLISALLDAPGVVLVDRLNLDSPGLERLKSGAVRLVVPLIHSGELVGWLSLGALRGERSYSMDNRSLLTRLAAQAAPAVQVALLVHQQQVEAVQRERIEHELRLAERIQRSLLPKNLPELQGWGVAVHYRPAREVGGDFYDLITFEDGRLGVFVGDVTGKGVPAALLMATTRSILRAVAQADLPPGETLRQVNNILVNDVPPSMFVTCFYAVLDPTTGELRCANAGHNLPYLRREGGAIGLHARGMPLGLLPGQNYEERGFRVIPGGGLLFYSDGLVEAHNPAGEMFGSAQLEGLLIRSYQDGQELIECLLSALQGFTGEAWEQEDDITLVTLFRSA